MCINGPLPGRWEIPVEYRPSRGFLDTVDYESLGRAFGAVLSQHHPEITGLVGTPTLGARQLTPDSIVRSMVGGMRGVKGTSLLVERLSGPTWDRITDATE